ncbi:MBL fold metallo-hydrolase [Persicobacter diffluens]|uniref:Metallo-beta-lactamase domain-containing protein n=1 Tax=Persicobacter diffluens TaxID=981 RepID=A0AAN4VY86_9BACT|nr:hypothetical protein PEDI_11120 [Persicobacter diffluens]
MGNTSIQLIRNATLKINYAGKTLLIDPMLGEKHSIRSFVVPDQNLNPTVDLTMPVSDILEGLDAIFLTHAHPDHFDPAAMEMLPKNLPFFAQPFDAKMLADSPFENVKVIEDSTEFEGITIHRTGGKHGPEHVLEALGQVSGFVLQAEGAPTIYIIGDCLWDAEIEGNIEKYNPEVIVMNAGGAVFMGADRILMDEEEAIKVAKKAPNATKIAVHIASLDHCQVSRTSLAEKAQQAAVELLIPQDGSIIEL